MHIKYNTKGICAARVEFDIEDGVVKNISFLGGCDGNLQGISQLVRGRKVEDVIDLLAGIRCGFKETSCPDQLARGLAAILEQSK